MTGHYGLSLHRCENPKNKDKTGSNIASLVFTEILLFWLLLRNMVIYSSPFLLAMHGASAWRTITAPRTPEKQKISDNRIHPPPIKSGDPEPGYETPPGADADGHGRRPGEWFWQKVPDP